MTRNPNPNTNTGTNTSSFDIDTLAGLVSGTTQAALLNPWDRALYLSVKDRRPFLSWPNFYRPYYGFGQAAVQRVISSGLYFVLQHQAQVMLAPYFAHHQVSNLMQNITIGCVAGTLNGLLLNPLASIKYYSWGKDGWPWLLTIQHMHRRGGVVPFFKGAMTTASRDMVFGCIYEVARWELRAALHRRATSTNTDSTDTDTSKSMSSFLGVRWSAILCNMIAASMATVASAPLNYVRNMKYASHAHAPDPSMLSVFRELGAEAAKIHDPYLRVRYVLQSFRIGWGTARIGVGCALGQLTFDACRHLLDPHHDASVD